MRANPFAVVASSVVVALAAAACGTEPPSARGEPHHVRLPGVACNGAVVVAYSDLTSCPAANVASCSDYPNKPNGCGPAQGLAARIAAQIAQGPFPFTSCCNGHDVAYGTCNAPAFGAGKTAADNTLKTCMTNLCTNSYPGPNLPGAARVWRACCNKSAALIAAAVNLGGQTAYESAQRNACTCTTGTDAGPDAATTSPQAVPQSPQPVVESLDAATSADDGGAADACPCDPGTIDLTDPNAIGAALTTLTSCPTSNDWYKNNPPADAGTP